jgi:hypothetical protein
VRVAVGGCCGRERVPVAVRGGRERESICLLTETRMREKVFAVKRLVGQSYLPKRVTLKSLFSLSFCPSAFRGSGKGPGQRAQGKRAFTPSPSYYSLADENREFLFLVGARSIDRGHASKTNKISARRH